MVNLSWRNKACYQNHIEIKLFIISQVIFTVFIYELAILPEISGEIIVVITGLEENTDPITNCYERITTQVYLKHLKTIEINKIIWIERSIDQTSEEEFFKVDLIWDEKSKFFHSPQWKPCDPAIIFFIKRHCAEYAG